ncbi:MAG: GDSL-type esterase/lipase family protein [Gemmataceae bacterium]
MMRLTKLPMAFLGLLTLATGILAFASHESKSSPATPTASSVAPVITGNAAQFVRIELPGEKRILTLAEVEVISNGKNIARSGKATQSSTNGAAVASRAIDGNKDPDYNKQGQTHTSNAGEKNPWWELDLGKVADVEKIGIWNRKGFESRLEGFTVTLLDAERKVAFRVTGIAAPEAMELDVKTGKLTYLAFDGKLGKPAADAANTVVGGGKSPDPKKTKNPKQEEQDPALANYRDPLPFAFKKGDVVAILGNGLADRMQHDGWLETHLQAQLVDQHVRFRTMAASGDRPNDYPRSPGQISMAAYLQKVQPTVVFAFFGYNESFDGKPAEYKQRLIDFVKKTRAAKPNGKDIPRIVLFSPIAFEDTHNPNLPDGKAYNVRLAAYTRATEAAAKEAGVAYVDLFHPSLELFNKSKRPLTINGAHLSDEGNRQLAEVIARELFGKPPSTSGSLESLRQAVLDKSMHWWNRYRASDGNDTWGSRAGLKFVNGQSNADVLLHELVMLDVMTANRDEVVWARAAGKDKTVDDKNVPAPVPVISNIGGGSKAPIRTRKAP